MPDSDIQTIAFSGDLQRQRGSFAREYAVKLVSLSSGESLTEEIDVRRAAGIAVSVDTNMDGTHLAVYASAEMGGTKRPVYDKDDSLLIVTAEDDAIVVLPAETFPLGYIALASCSDATGTLETESADRVFVVMMKP